MKAFSHSIRNLCVRLALTSGLVTGLSWMANPVAAQTFPDKPVRIISGVGVGGTFDIFIRALAEELTKRWGQGVIIEPRPGGNFVLASKACATAAPDGYTLCSLSGDNIVYPEFLVKNLDFDLREGLKPISLLFFNPQMLVVTSELKARTIPQVIEQAKKRQGKLAFMAPAPPSRLFMEDLNQKHGLDIVNLPFRGGSDALSNLMSGSVHFVFTGAANFPALIEAGNIYPLVVDSDERLSAYPDVPTMREARYQGPISRNYLGLVGPRGIPDAIMNKINADVNSIMNDPAFRKRHMIDRGVIPANGSMQDFAKFIEQDRTASKQVVQDAKLSPE